MISWDLSTCSLSDGKLYRATLLSKLEEIFTTSVTCVVKHEQQSVWILHCCSVKQYKVMKKINMIPKKIYFGWLFFTFFGEFLCCRVKKSGFHKGLMIPWFLQSLAVSQRHHGVSLSVSPGGPVPSKASCGGDCCGLLRLPLPSEIDELIVGLLPVCLCPGWRRPGYGWESQLWHPPWGYYCGRPAGGPGGWWPPGAALTHILLSHPWRHSGTLPDMHLWLAQTKWLSVECCDSTGKLPDCAKLLLMAAVRKGQKRKTT